MSRRRLSVLFTPAEIDALPLDDTIAVLVDVLRATSVIPVGLAAGATAFLPVASVDSARALHDQTPGALLCGERNGRAPEGFDLGNSPFEYTPDRVRGRELVFTSTNGAPALLWLRQARIVYTGAFVNESALVDVLLEHSNDVVLVASGKDRRPSLEDVAFCGCVCERLLAQDFVPDDGAHMAQAIWKTYEHDLLGMLATSSHGAWLAANGYAADLEFCARRAAVSVVPILENDRVVAMRSRRE
jgi:2-phosphosulfolactate phosphatase